MEAPGYNHVPNGHDSSQCPMGPMGPMSPMDGSDPRTVGGTTLSYIPNEADCMPSFSLSSTVAASSMPSIQSVSKR